MPSLRVERVQSLLRSEISTVLQRKVKDPRVGMVTITDVIVTPDLRHARVLISTLGEDGVRPEALAGLISAAGFIRAELMKVLDLRPMPALEFEPDIALERAARTLDLMDRIRHEHEREDGPGQAPGDSDDPDR